MCLRQAARQQGRTRHESLHSTCGECGHGLQWPSNALTVAQSGQRTAQLVPAHSPHTLHTLKPPDC